MLHGVALVRTDIRSALQLLVTANFVRSSYILVTLIMEALLSAKTSVLTRATCRNIPEDGILRRSNNCKQCISTSFGITFNYHSAASYVIRRFVSYVFQRP
jgi:hypothetical protein